MVKQKIFIWFVSTLLMVSNLSSQSLSKQKPRTLLWGLITIDKESEYEDGYWFDKWFRSREFAAPITYMPVEIPYGLVFNGKFSGISSLPSAGDFDNWIWYDLDGNIVEAKSFNEDLNN